MTARRRTGPNNRPVWNVDPTTRPQADREAEAKAAGWDGWRAFPYNLICHDLRPHGPHDYTAYLEPRTCSGYLQPKPQPTPGTVAQRAVSRYDVCALPEGHEEYHSYLIVVERCPQADGTALWAVRRLKQCLAADGTWSYEPQPSSREDEWLTRHRHDLNTALALAEKHAVLLSPNGYTAAMLLAGVDPVRRMGEQL